MDFSKLLQAFSYKTKVHPIRMFAIILYAYSRGIYSTRDIENACIENIKFRFLLQDSKLPDHSTISRFLNKIEEFLPELFEQFIKKIFEMENISTETIYIDGTKTEAYANRYSFVWKKSIKNYWNKLNVKIQSLVFDFNQDFSSNFSSFFEVCHYLQNLNINFVYGRGKRKSKEQKYYELCIEYLEKKGYTSYIKPIYFEKSKTRKFKNDLNRVENLIYNSAENRLFRKDGVELKFIYSSKNGRKQYFFNPETQKKIGYNSRFRMLSTKSQKNISNDFYFFAKKEKGFATDI